MANIVNDQSPPTPAQHSEFWQQVDKGLITKKNFQEFLEKKKIDTNLFPRETSHLRLIGETNISATKAGVGMRLSNQKLFYRVDPSFDECNAQTASIDTDEVTAYVYKQIKKGAYVQIFGSLNKDLDLLLFETHEQIKDFFKNSLELLRSRGTTTHFLFKNKSGELFVAFVMHDSGGDLSVALEDFSSHHTWSAANAEHFVVLATKTLESKS